MICGLIMNLEVKQHQIHADYNWSSARAVKKKKKSLNESLKSKNDCIEFTETDFLFPVRTFQFC